MSAIRANPSSFNCEMYACSKTFIYKNKHTCKIFYFTLESRYAITNTSKIRPFASILYELSSDLNTYVAQQFNKHYSHSYSYQLIYIQKSLQLSRIIRTKIQSIQFIQREKKKKASVTVRKCMLLFTGVVFGV